MRTRRFAFLAALLTPAVLLATPGPARAREPGVFPPPLTRGAEITVLKSDHSSQRATFLGPGSTPDHVLLGEPRVRSWRGVNRYELAREDVSAIEARPTPGFEPKRMAIGVLAGMILGGMIGVMVDPGHPGYIVFDSGGGFYTGRQNSQIPNITYGMAAGAAIGLLFGMLASPTRGPVQRWSYAEPAPDPAPASPDTAQVPIR